MEKTKIKKEDWPDKEKIYKGVKYHMTRAKTPIVEFDDDLKPWAGEQVTGYNYHDYYVVNDYEILDDSVDVLDLRWLDSDAVFNLNIDPSKGEIKQIVVNDCNLTHNFSSVSRIINESNFKTALIIENKNKISKHSKIEQNDLYEFIIANMYTGKLKSGGVSLVGYKEKDRIYFEDFIENDVFKNVEVFHKEYSKKEDTIKTMKDNLKNKKNVLVEKFKSIKNKNSSSNSDLKFPTIIDSEDNDNYSVSNGKKL